MGWGDYIELRRAGLIRLVMAWTTLLRILGSEGAGGVPMLPRHARLALVRLVRPAEAAARRLIAATATVEGLALPVLGPLRPRAATATGGARRTRGAPAFRLADPVPTLDALRRAATRTARPARRPGPGPRITFLDETRTEAAARERREAMREEAARREAEARRLRAEDASALAARLRALRGALDDLPKQAKRLMRWRAAQHRLGVAGRPHRVDALRGGRPRDLPRSLRAREPVHHLLDESHQIARNAGAAHPRE